MASSGWNRGGIAALTVIGLVGAAVVLRAPTPAGAEPLVPPFRARTHVLDVGGDNPTQKSDSIVTGDLDEDGRDDVIDLGYGTTATVHLSTGDPGSFAPGTTFGVGQQPVSWHLVDVDHDHHLDLVLGQPSAGVYTFLGTGTGTFGPAIVSSGSGGFTALGDVDGDGTLDVATGTAGAIQVRLGAGDGSFAAAAASYEVSGTVSGIDAADFDGDGRADVAVTTWIFAGMSFGPGSLVVRPATTGGALGEPVLTQSLAPVVPSPPMTGDLDGDDHTDLAVVDGSHFRRFFGDGDGGFPTSVDEAIVTEGAQGPPVLVDLDDDGDLDLAYATDSSYLIVVRRNDGNGSFPAVRYLSDQRPRSLATPDLDGDGVIDLAWVDASWSARAVSYLRGRGQGWFDGSTGTGNHQSYNPYASRIADFDGDGTPDVVTWRANDGAYATARVYLNDGDGYLVSNPLFTLATGIGDLTPISLGPDEHLDLVACTTSGLQVATGHGDGHFDAPTSIALEAPPTTAVAGDFDEDGHDDLATTLSDANQLAVLLGDGAGGLGAPTTFPTGATPMDVVAEDFDEDGHLDLAVVNASNIANSASILLGDGDGGFAPKVDLPLAATPSHLAAGDLDGDGNLDLLVATPSGGATVIRALLGAGDGSFATGPFQTVNVTLGELPLADLNGDGTLDLAVWTYLHLLNRGDATFSDVQVLTDPAGEQITTSQPADFDGDGRMDLLGAPAGNPFVRYGAAPPTAPMPPPTAVAAIADGEDVALTWAAPTPPPGHAITGYLVKPYVGNAPQPPIATGSTQTTHQVTGLSVGEPYRFRVAALSDQGTGTWSALSNPVTPRERYAPFASWGDLVDRIYLDLLQRPPSTGERSADVTALSDGSLTPGALVARIRAGADHRANVDAVVRLYRAYFLRNADPSGLDHWVAVRRTGSTLSRISSSFAASSEFKRRYGTLTNRQFVELIYQNVLGRPGEPSGVAFWTKQLDTRRKGRGQVMLNFSDSSEYKTKQTSEVDVGVLQTWMLRTIPAGATFTDAVAALDGGTTVAEFAAQLIASDAYATRIAKL